MATGLRDPCPMCDCLRPKRAVAQPEVCYHTFLSMGMPVITIGPAQSPERPYHTVLHMAHRSLKTTMMRLISLLWSLVPFSKSTAKAPALQIEEHRLEDLRTQAARSHSNSIQLSCHQALLPQS